MHDYKNQLSTIQTLIKNGHTNEALLFTQKLTESIAVEMSAINTNHPVVNAVLNQKYRSMQEKHIAVILKVGDLQEICLEEEEIVILLSNLLDNAIRESEKVLKNTGKAVIHLKLECEDHKLIFAIRNPVTATVEIENDMGSLWTNTRKRAITKEDIHKLIELDLSDRDFYTHVC